MFNFFKKKEKQKQILENSLDIQLTATILGYEVARSDGNIEKSELQILLDEIKKVAAKVSKKEDEILEIIKTHSENSVSFHEFIEDINASYSKNDKYNLLYFLWNIAFADGKLDVDEERLIRRVADLIKIKNLDVLKIREKSKNLSKNSNIR
tara:strand:- start:21 stop:476 length:456 start_codon:yes stop_codon:yes gene_type:complete